MSEKGRILVVDDDRLQVALISDQLISLGYKVTKGFSGEEALSLAGDSKHDAILLDIVMADMDGYEVCKRLKESDVTRHIPVIMLTALDDKESKYKGLEVGAIDFLNKPLDMVELTIKLRNAIKIKEHHDFLKDYNNRLEREVEKRTCELRESFLDTIYRLTLAAEYRDRGTASHLTRVSHYVSFLAKTLGMSDKEAEVMFHASPMHDIGKIGIPDEILLNDGKLTAKEFDLMKRHTVIGGNILYGAGSEYLKSASKFALYHHEHWNGTGYPHKLKGEGIPIEGRLMLVVDRYDALRSPRPYKTAYNHEKTMKILTGNGSRSEAAHFDPTIFEAFNDNHREFEKIYDEHKDLDPD